MTHHRFNLSNYKFSREIEVLTDLEHKEPKYEGLWVYYGESLLDLRKKWGIGEKQALKRLNKLKSEGKVTVLRIPIRDISDRLNYSTRYVIELDKNGSKE